MRVLVTGAAGFVGLNIVKACMEAGHETFAHVRAGSNLTWLDQMGATCREADILDAEGMKKAAEGVEAIIHCAAHTSGFRKDRDLVMRTNIDGAKNVVEAALANGVRRIVYTGTTSTVGSHSDGRPADETVPVNGYRAKSQYAVSKLAAEKIILEARQRGLEVIVLKPAEVLGAFDYRFQWGTVVKMVHDGKLPFLPLGAASFCHAEEVGRAHVTALTGGRDGESYILAGTDTPLPEMVETIARVIGKPMPPKPFFNSPLMFRTVFGCMELFGATPPLDQTRLRVFYEKLLFGSEKAIRELGFAVRPLEEMIEACYGWYQDNGLLSD